MVAYGGSDDCRDPFNEPYVEALYNSTCLQWMLLYPSKRPYMAGVPSSEGQAGVEGSVLHVYGRLLCR